eukprot:12662425-Alexandrium_andersonii.AAC.1
MRWAIGPEMDSQIGSEIQAEFGVGHLGIRGSMAQPRRSRSRAAQDYGTHALYNGSGTCHVESQLRWPNKAASRSDRLLG